MPFVSVIIPLYNEEGRIGPNLGKIVTFLAKRFSDFEVIAVDDGSTDKTAKILEEAGRLESRIRPLSFFPNHGKGFAVKQGMLAARGDAILFTDADLSTPIEAAERALQELVNGYSVVIASRRHPESVIPAPQGRIRESLGRCFNLTVRALFPLPFLDTQCGFKCFSRKAAVDIFSRTRISGLTFDVEVLLIARRLGYAICEIPISWTDSPRSKVKLPREAWRVAKELWDIYRNDRAGLYRG